MTHLYEHWRFTGDMDFLANTALPILTGLVEFYNDFLIERDGYLVTAPSASTENNYVTPGGVNNAIAIGPTADNYVWKNLPSRTSYLESLLRDDDNRSYMRFTLISSMPRHILAPHTFCRKLNLFAVKFVHHLSRIITVESDNGGRTGLKQVIQNR